MGALSGADGGQKRAGIGMMEQASRSTQAQDTPEAFAAVDEIGADEALVVDVEGYEGPLHLLLDLARRQRVDLRRVSVLALAQQYLAFIREAKARRIDLAAEYLVMASWLAFLKSKMMLPAPQKPETDEETGEGMAQRLAFRLARLEAMREAADNLFDGALLGRDVFARGMPEQPKVVKHTQYDTTLYHLAQAFGAITGRREQEKPHTVERQFVLPLEIARDRLRGIAPKLEQWRAIQDLSHELGNLELPERSRLASLFSATLELARDGDVDMRQDCHFAPLYLKAPVRAKAAGKGGEKAA